jgi:hypothetical protein
LNIHAPKEDKIDDIKDSLYEEIEHVFDKFPKLNENFIRDFNAQDIFKPTTGSNNLYKISNNNGLE